GELLDGELGLEHVATRFAPGAGSLARLALSLPDSLASGIVDQARQLEVRDGDRDQVLALAPDQLLVAEVAPQLLAHATAHDLPDALDVGFDLGGHLRRIGLSAPSRRRARRCSRRSAGRR